MKALLIAHHGDIRECERAYDLVNSYRHMITSHHVADTDKYVVNLDVVRSHLPRCNALLVLPSRYDVPGRTDWEAARVEQEAVLLAHRLHKPVGVIGKSVSILRPYLTRYSDLFRMVGPYCEPSDQTGGLSDTFSHADIIPVSDMNLGAKVFMARFSAQAVRESAA